MPITKNTVLSEYKKLVGRISGAMTEEAVTKILLEGQKNALLITPSDTGNLISSQFRFVNRTAEGWKGGAGYTADYALYVHEAPGTLLGTNTPRGKNRGNVWSPDAEPQFLVKGFERDGAQEIQRILATEYKI